MRTRAWVGAAVIAALAATATPLAAQSAGDGDLAKGVRLVDEGDFESAITSLNAAVARLQGRGGAPAELSRAYLYLAIAHLGLSQEQAARAKFLEAIQTDRSLKLSPHEFPPKVIQAFEQARKDSGVPPTSAPPPLPSPVAPPPAASRGIVPPAVFFEAVKQGDFAAVRQLLSEDPGLARQKDEKFGATALHWAALRGHQAIAALLVAQGANVEAVNKDGETAFQVAQRANRPELAALVRPAGGAPQTTIFEAAKRGDVAAVEQIVAKSPELARQKDTAFGATPLHWAALRGHEAVVSALLARGADPRAANNDGETPLQVAQRANRAGVVRLLMAALSGTAPATAPRSAPAAATTSSTPARPAPAPAATAVGTSEFFEAVRSGSVATVNALLAKNPALVRERDPQYGATALHWAALRGHENVADLLLAQGADLKATNSAGETPLQVAERAGHVKVVGLLRAAARNAPANR